MFRAWNLTPDYVFLHADVPLDAEQFSGLTPGALLAGHYVLVDGALD